jgi:class 3 adenylate cyclase/tetratricopeptide (TPR) repeat protein
MPPMSTESPLTGDRERRIVTVIFADVSGFTALGDQLDVEDLTLLLDGLFARFARVVGEYGGMVDRFLGDAIMAVFGAPVAHEDDAERAIRAAVAVQRQAVELAYANGLRIRLAMGLHTGSALAGQLGGGESVGYTVIGEAVNGASRLRALAEPGQILVSGATRDRALAICDPVPLGEKVIHPGRDPVRVYEVRELSLARRASGGLLPEDAAPLVGRRAQLRQLEHLLSVGAEGQGSVVLAYGEVGVGKTRLALAARELATSQGYRVVSGYADSWDDGVIQGLVPRLLRDLLDLDPEEDAETAAVVLRRFMEGLGLPRVEARVARCVGFLGGEDRGEGDATSRRDAACETLAEVFQAAAAAQPLLVIADNLQWTSDAGLEVLQALARRCAGRALVLLGLARTGGETRLLATFPGAHPMRLARLDVRRTGELAAALLGVDEFPPHMATLMAERTGGNPFFIEETVKSLVSSGTVPRGGPVPELEELHIPTTVEEVILARIDRLEAGARAVLQVASVIGRTFRRDLLLRAMDLDNASLDQHLRVLEDEQLVFPISSGQSSEFLFRNYVTRDVAYGTLLRRHRARYHARIAAAIEELFASSLGDHLQILANHYLETDLDEKKARYLLMAGEAAFRAGNHADGERYLLLADEVMGPDDELRDDLDFTLAELFQSQARHLEAVERLTAIVERTASEPRRLVALVRRGQNLHQLGEIQQAEDDLRAVISRGGEVETLASAYRQLAILRRDQGRGDAALGYAAEALRTLEGSPNEASIAQVYGTYGDILGVLGQDEKALEYSQQALAIFERLGARAELAQQYNNIGIRYRRSGDLGRARSYYKRCLELATELGSWREIAHAHHNLGVVHALGGSAAQALASYREALSIREQYGAEREIAVTHLAMAELLRQEGQLEEARDSIEKGIRTFRRLGMIGVLGPAFVDLAKVLIDQGDLAAATRAIRQASNYARQTNQDEHLRQARVLEAEVLATEGRLQDADRILTEIGGPDTAFRHGKLLLRADPRRAAACLAQAEAHARAAVEQGLGDRELLEIQALRAGLDAALGEIEEDLP